MRGKGTDPSLRSGRFDTLSDPGSLPVAALSTCLSKGFALVRLSVDERGA